MYLSRVLTALCACAALLLIGASPAGARATFGQNPVLSDLLDGLG